jgi:hypothetical protein
VIRLRSILVLAFLLAAAPPARADVVILDGNDVPLTGTIVYEDDEELGFRVKGLPEESFLVIGKERVRSYWREETTRFEHLSAGNEDRDAAPRPEARTPAPGPVARVPRPRAVVSRESRIQRAVDRMAAILPRDPGLRILAWLTGFGALSLLFFLGGRLADLEKMGLGRAAILTLITQFLLMLGVLAYRSVSEPMTVPLIFTGLVVAWALSTRMLAGDRYTKSILLLSFSVAAVLLVGGSLFSVLSFVE